MNLPDYDDGGLAMKTTADALCDILDGIAPPSTTLQVPADAPGATHSVSAPSGDDWFVRQLAIASERARDWPDWARKEAGLPVASEGIVGTAAGTSATRTCPHCGQSLPPGATCGCLFPRFQAAPVAVGWRCPGCGAIWAPSVRGCERCNVVGPEESELDGTRRVGCVVV